MIKQLSFKNIKGGPKSTGLGSLLIVFALYMIYKESSEMADYIVNGGILTTGISLFFISDTKKPIEDEGKDSSI